VNEVKKNKTNPDIKRKVHIELIDILYNQIIYMLWAEAFAGTLILAILWWNSPNKILILSWYFGMIFLTGIPRYYIAKKYARASNEHKRCKGWEKSLMFMLFITGIGWSFAGTVLLPTDSRMNQAFVLFLLVGVAAAANPFYSPVKKIYATFLIPTLFFSAFFLLIKGTNYAVFTGIALTAFGMLMLITSVISSELISNSLLLRFKNLELTKNLLKTNIRLEKLATHDTLTDLPNRPFFYEKLMQMIRDSATSEKSFALLFLDLDLFKNVNDTLGHDIGDQVLVQVAEVLNQVKRPEDLACRLGGDEFILLLADAEDLRVVSAIAKQLCLALAKPFTIKGKEARVSASIGISVYPDDGKEEKTLVQKADTAMYEAKSISKGGYLFYNKKLVIRINNS
jgi:diguanylate cyclase (GGDEF)-like protein